MVNFLLIPPLRYHVTYFSVYYYPYIGDLGQLVSWRLFVVFLGMTVFGFGCCLFQVSCLLFTAGGFCFRRELEQAAGRNALVVAWTDLWSRRRQRILAGQLFRCRCGSSCLRFDYWSREGSLQHCV